MIYLSKNIEHQMPRPNLFIEDVLLVDETMKGVNAKVELSWDALGSRNINKIRSIYDLQNGI